MDEEGPGAGGPPPKRKAQQLPVAPYIPTSKQQDCHKELMRFVISICLFDSLRQALISGQTATQTASVIRVNCWPHLATFCSTNPCRVFTNQFLGSKNFQSAQSGLNYSNYSIPE